MKFLIFNGSLKPDGESNTFAVCKMAQLAFEKLGHSCEIVTMRELDYEGSTDDVNDDLKPYIMKMFNMDGVIFATPIWWGTHSCHIQAMLERLDFIYSWAKDNKYQPFYNKVFGTLVSGGGDGFQHIHGVLYSAASNFGFTVPPQCNIESKAQGIDEIKDDEDTLNQVKNCTINMVTWASILKAAQPNKNARHGSVDINESMNETDWNKLRQADAVMPYLYDSPELRAKGEKPNPREPNIITSVNLKEPRRPGDRLTPLYTMGKAAWQKYMDDAWTKIKQNAAAGDPGAKEKFDQIKQAAADAGMPIMEGKRIPRKKGQKRKSKKHSDLYTDEDPKGTIHGLGFKDEATARSSVAKIRKSGRSHAHKIQAAVAMEQRARAAGKSGPAAIYRKYINSMKKKTKAKNKKK